MKPDNRTAHPRLVRAATLVAVAATAACATTTPAPTGTVVPWFPVVRLAEEPAPGPSPEFSTDESADVIAPPAPRTATPSGPSAPVARFGIAGIGSSVSGGMPRPIGTPAHAFAARRTTAEYTLEAIDVLAPHVRRMSHPAALRTAFHAYYNFRAANPDAVRKPYLYFVDFGLTNSSARGYVFDMETLSVVDGPFMVAHGRGSSDERNGVPTWFSNRNGSYATSLGLYVAEEIYTFRGTSNGRAYRSTGLRMRGESGRFNSAARSRGIVAHGAPYVTRTDAGRSEGCPAMEPARAERLLPMIADGGVVFHYSPIDDEWLQSDPWVTAAQN